MEENNINPTAATPAPEAPVTPVNPATAATPVVNPAAATAPAVDPTAAPVIPEPVAPVFQPTAAQTTPVDPVASTAPTAPTFNPEFTAPAMDLPTSFGATDPISMPEPTAAPDPVEEELRAPFKAAEPVPGSIGSAISVPAEGAEPNAATEPQMMADGFTSQIQPHAQSVAFNDPATTPEMNPVMGTTSQMVDPAMGNPAKPAKAKKQTNKGTLIALAVIAGVIIVGLAGYLIWLINQGN